MKFGAHVSILGGLEKAPKRAHDVGCECFQIFSRSPQGGGFAKITEKIAANFKKETQKYKIKDYYIHTPYYINLASKNNRIYYGSISAIKEELKIAEMIGAKAVITHLGSAKDLGLKKAEKKIVEALEKVFQLPPSPKGKTVEKKYKANLFLEITAGSGEILGDKFEEIAFFIKETEKEITGNKLGVCFDTAHAFASGYDLRSQEAVVKTFDKFDRVIGVERLKLVHCNDSASELNSRKDRHENIGRGEIGIEGFRAIVNDLRLKNADFIIETPNNKEKEDLEILKKLRGNKNTNDRN